MNKYVAVEMSNKNIRLHKAEEVSYTPAGWHKPYNYYTLDDMHKAKKHPSQKRPALIRSPGLVTRANNARIVTELTFKAIDEIDDMILQLRKKRQSLIYERFRTFPLVQEGDLERSRDKVFATRQEAEKD